MGTQCGTRKREWCTTVVRLCSMRQIDDVNWDDIRLFTTLASSTSFRDAAERLGMTHPTVRRRLESLEGALGLRLFHRRQDGLHLTVEGAELVDSSREVERSVLSLLRNAEAVDRELKGPVRVTMPTELALRMAPALAAFQNRWPAIELFIETSTHFADLARSEADVAVRGYRHGRQPPDYLAGRNAVTGCAAVYGDAGASPYWIGAVDEPPGSGWTATEDYADLPVRSVIPNVLARRAACAAGMGIAMLPCTVGDPDLKRLTDPADDFDIWVLVHPDLRANPRLRVFRDEMVKALSSMKDVLRGTSDLGH